MPVRGLPGRRGLPRRTLLAAGLGAAVIGVGCTAAPRPEPPPPSPGRQRIAVADHGATGDGSTDDTAAVQRAVDAAAVVDGEVFFGPGTYVVTTVHLVPGIWLTGDRATIRRPPTRGKDWLRTFTTEDLDWDSETDSAPLVVRNLTFDGNRLEQGPYQSYELEHAHLLHFTATPGSKGRLVARVSDCRFVDGVGDGINIRCNVALTVERCEAVDVFRGGFVMVGGGCEVDITDFTTRGATDRTGIDIEIMIAGYGGSFASHVRMRRVRLHDGDFDIAIRDGGTFDGDDIMVSRPPITVSAPGGTVRIRRSIFHVGPWAPNANRIVYPGDVEFRECTFVADPDGEPPPVTVTMVRLMTTSWPRSRLSLSLVDCTFTTVPDLPADVTVRAVQVDPDSLARGNVVRVVGGTVDDRVDEGVWVSGGGRVEITGTMINSTTVLRAAGLRGSGFDVTLAELELGPGTALRIDLADARSLLRISDVVVHEPGNAIRSERPESLARLRVQGGRTVLGRQSPQGRSVPGLAGDEFLVGSGSAVRRWLCTRSDAVAADWRRAD
ncbi:glycosyl hydrolase family 28-related protein [Propionibacteriaceae bacterium Y2011]|uniref:glycosyl hydrolase family 28-related protein n=1 Tax=Microlunatus sp. Y2014 TaxID=3418488 RepID=UPI003B4AF895